MGRKTKRGKKATGANGPKKAAGTKSNEKFSIDEILDKVDEYMDSFDLKMAQMFCQRALEMDPDHDRALVTSGILLLEGGEMEKAKQCFGRAIEIAPDTDHSKYMYMGQLITGSEAVAYFEKGIELMKTKLKVGESSESAEESGVSKQDISNAYCSIAEIFLTDQCMEEEAESRCQACLEEALKEDSENPEAYQLFGSFWLSKDDKVKAREVLEKGVSLWLPQWRETEKPEGAALDPVELCPLSYPARMNAAKLLIEVESFDMASEILELLLDEADEVVEVWYMLGWLNHLQGEDYKGNARYYLNKAMEVATKTKYDDEDVLKHTKEIIELLGPAESEEENGVDDAEDESDMDTDEETMEH